MKKNLRSTKFKSVKIEGELERAYEKCMVWFFAYPKTRIGLTGLSKLIKSSKTATKEAVESLFKQKFLSREIAGKAWILSANLGHRYFITKKVPYHLDRIYQTGVVEAVHEVLPQARAVILFGSYRWGSDTEDSDIDIAAEVLGNQEPEIMPLGKIEQVGYRKNVQVNLYIFSRDKVDLNLFANIVNGIVLDGFLEVRI